MKFLICPVPASFIEFNGSTEGLFTEDGKTFYFYKVEYNEEDTLVITDAVGRFVPFDYTDLAGLTNILTRINEFQEVKSAVHSQLVQSLFNSR